MKFIVSDNAKTELRNVLETKKDPNRHFRIYIRGYSWGGPLFDVGLDDERESDYSEDFESSKILVDQDYLNTFGGFEVDYMKNFFNKGFSVRPFKYGGRC